MARTTRTSHRDLWLLTQFGQRLGGAALLAGAALAAYMAISLFSYHPNDPAWSHTGGTGPIANLGGRIGAWFADGAIHGLGFLAYTLPPLALLFGWQVFRGSRQGKAISLWTLSLRWLGLLLVLATATSLAALHFVGEAMPISAGGGVGAVIAALGMAQFGLLGGTLVLFAVFLSAWPLLIGLSWFQAMDGVGGLVFRLWDELRGQPLQSVAPFLDEAAYSPDPPPLSPLDRPKAAVTADGDEAALGEALPSASPINGNLKQPVTEAVAPDWGIPPPYPLVDDEDTGRSSPTRAFAAVYTDALGGSTADISRHKQTAALAQTEDTAPVFDLSPDDLSADDLSVNDLSPDDLSPDDLSPDDLSVNDLSVNDLSADDLSADDLSVNDLLADDLSPDDLASDDIPVRRPNPVLPTVAPLPAEQATKGPSVIPESTTNQGQLGPFDLDDRAMATVPKITLPTAHDDAAESSPAQSEGNRHYLDLDRLGEVNLDEVNLDEISLDAIILTEGPGLSKPTPSTVDDRPAAPSKIGSPPPLDLLDAPAPADKADAQADIDAMARQVEAHLAAFGIEAGVAGVEPGPVITRFELNPPLGLKSSKIANLNKDLARSLSVVSVRVVEVIPGKSTIGLEIPNQVRETVYLREILASEAYRQSRSPLTIALGKDIGGIPRVADLGKMPHLLVAGTTGSGKSVAINAMLLTLLYKSTPTEVRLILIDPKMLELSVYEGIPHLLTPVVTDMRDAANALRWCVGEMEQRYRLMSLLGVRNIAGYNNKVEAAITRGAPLPNPFYEVSGSTAAATLAPLPYIVVVVDEFADMMMVVGKKVEKLIVRLAQKARAAGVHLILATQRPTVDVITGLIKANIPVRIAFKVSAKLDSRTIIDQIGAETLLGNGDMLYIAPGTSVPERLHGAFVADHEVHGVADYLKRLGPPNYLAEILANGDEGLEGAGLEE